jgi:hypothetical protein
MKINTLQYFLAMNPIIVLQLQPPTSLSLAEMASSAIIFLSFVLSENELPLM